MDEKPLFRTGILDNPAFRRYVENLPTTRRRITLLPNGKVVVITQTGDGPVEVGRRAPGEKENQ